MWYQKEIWADRTLLWPAYGQQKTLLEAILRGFVTFLTPNVFGRERKTGLGPATSTLARLRSTN